MTTTRVARTTSTLPTESLSPREEEAVEYVWQGLSNAEIGARMYITPKVVEAHLTNARRKLGVSGRVGLALWAERKKHADYAWSLQPI